MRSYLFLLLIIFAGLNCSAQQGILFKIKYLPKHNYNAVINSNFDMQMDLAGSVQQKDSLKKAGAEFPIIIGSRTNMNIDVITGPVAEKENFPVTLKYVDIKSKRIMNGEETDVKSPLVGLAAYGHSDLDGLFQVDSIPGKAVNETLKKTISGTINAIRQQIKFPDGPMKVGESFSQDVPLTLPISGINMQMNVRVIYKLISITENKATFDVDESLSFDMKTAKDGTEISGNGSGKGSGKMIYNINENYPLNIDTNLEFNFNMIMKDLKFVAKARMTSAHKTVVTSL